MRPVTKSYLQQTFADARSFRLPGEIRDGQKADFYVSTSGENVDWYDEFARKAFRDQAKIWVWFALKRLRVYATTTSGKTFYARPEATFVEKVKEAARKQLKQDSK
jgi:hypothetical protein